MNMKVCLLGLCGLREVGVVDGAALTVHDEGVGVNPLFYIGYVRQKVGESHVYTHDSLELLLVVEGLTDGDDETCKTRDKTTQ